MRRLFERFDVRVSVTYGTVASLWIIFSDQILAAVFAGNPSLLVTISAIKGLAFVSLTMLVLFAVLRSELRKQEQLKQSLQNDITERTQTLEALRHSENRFSTIFHRSSIPISISQVEDARLVDVNDALVNLFGYKREDLIGRSALKVGIWIDPEKRAQVAETAAQLGSVRNIKLQAHTKSGETVYLLTSSELIDLGDVPHTVTMFIDITEQQKMEEQLQYQAMLLTNVSDAVISTDTNFNIRSWNPAAEAIYGWSAEEAIGKSVTGLVAGEYPGTTREEVLKHFESDGMWQGEAIHRRKDGSTIYLLTSTSYVADSDGNRIGVVSVNRDITKRKQMELALRESEQRFQRVADSAPVILWMSDPDCNVTFISQGWYDFTGQSEATGFGWGWLDALHPDDRERTKTMFRDFNEQQVSFQIEYRVRRQLDASYGWVIATGTPRYTDGGKFQGYIGSVIDVTERKRAQQDLQKAEQQRIRLEKEKEVLQLKERFLSVVSHEFRTPLAVITSSAELIYRYYDRLTRERQLEHVQEILSQAQFMVSLMEDVLTVNKARAGRLEFNPVRLNLIDFCQTTLERIQAVDQGKHHFHFLYENESLPVMMDEKLLQHILVNLLSNAVKYSPEGSEIRLEVKQQHGNIVLRLSDQGIGIPSESLSKLYDPFYRANNTGTIGGTGLGMTIVKESVDLHGGTITCESEPGIGTTFTVTLPAL
ncbi:MAG: PAS domain-containing sensor histidine kinase [Anaerolineae bacterium]|nr:PAS domain-containing sensor histidine kinase [Anaerolineae bacterium]